MKTFEGRPYKLVLFKKEGCGPCDQAAFCLNEALKDNPKYGEIVSVMQKENHSALVAAYELTLYPTVLILDKDNNEISRKVGARFLTTEWWLSALASIHEFRIRNNV